MEWGWVGRKSGVGGREEEWGGSSMVSETANTRPYLDLSVAPLQVPNQGESLSPC